MKVASVINSHTVAINVGSNRGARVGDGLLIANAINDPETGNVIGHYPNLKVVVTKVFPHFCLAETVAQKFPSIPPVTINIGDDVVKEHDDY